MNKRFIATLVGCIVAALATVALASATGHPKIVHTACFGVQVDSPGVSKYDVNTHARHKFCIVGRKGKNGKNGLNGAAGATGNTGATGAAGAVGPAGPKGDTGATGAVGPQGPAGVSDVPGPPGPAGDTGPAGPQGEPGPAGPAGPAGADGTNGLGNDTMTICLDGHGGINQAPCNGNQVAVEVVIVTPVS